MGIVYMDAAHLKFSELLNELICLSTDRFYYLHCQ